MPTEEPSRRELFPLISNLSRRPFRDRTGLHFVEGVRGVLHALDAVVAVETIVASEILLTNDYMAKRVRHAKRDGVPVARVTPEEFRAISRTERASGVAAILRQHWTPLASADPERGLCWLAVSRIRNTGNLGTILRTAEAVGAGGLFVLDDETDPFDPAVVRASMGGIFRLNLVRATLEDFSKWALGHGCRVVGTSPSAERSYTEIGVEGPLVIFLGEEREGMKPGEKGLCTDMARVPILGRADSLNVGVAAGVMLYEVLRRRILPSQTLGG